MFEETQLSDDDLRAALFDALVERLEAKALEEPSIALVNRMPTVLVVSRLGNLLTLSQGIGAVLLRGSLDLKDGREELRTFDVGRASIQSRLTITPDRIEGTPDEILDWILAKFLEWTASEEESRPPIVEPIGDNRPTPLPVTQERPPVPRAPRKTQSPPRSARLENRSTNRAPQTPPAIRETTKESPPRPQADKPREAEAAPPRPAPVQKTTPPALRTYELLLETAQRELNQAQALPAGSKYFLISPGVLVALAAEAFFNDLGSRAMPSWSRLQKLDPLEKAEVLNIELFNGKADWRVRPFQSVVTALGFRHALAHAHAETLLLARTTGRDEYEVPRTRPIAWQEHCSVATIQQWIVDVRLLIELFTGAHNGS
jgi:hypothetical protein